MQCTLCFLASKYLSGKNRTGDRNMGIATTVKERNQPVLRKVNQWVRSHPGSLSTPSQQAMETNARNAYFWRR